MQRTHRPIRTMSALAAVAALTLAACGGDDDEPAAEEPAAEEPADEPAEPAEEPADEPADEPVGEVAMSPSTLILADQDGDGTSVTVDGVDLPADGFIAVHSDGGGSPGPVIGVSDLLPAGTSSAVTITLDEPLTATGVVFPMVHIDTDANGIYEFGVVEGVDGPGTTIAGDVAVGPLTITLANGDEGAMDENTIVISGFAFDGVTEVPIGTTVTVVNEDGSPHTWSSLDGTFDSGGLAQGESFEFTFTEAGTYDYICNIHPSMTGQIVVTG